jgi:hypothetical protein
VYYSQIIEGKHIIGSKLDPVVKFPSKLYVSAEKA